MDCGTEFCVRMRNDAVFEVLAPFSCPCKPSHQEEEGVCYARKNYGEEFMKISRKFLVGAGFAAILASLSGSQVAQAQSDGGDVMVPVFEADGLWPKPLPYGVIIGQTIGLAADKQDNIWIIHRPGSLEEKEVYATRKQGDCCTAAPDV